MLFQPRVVSCGVNHPEMPKLCSSGCFDVLEFLVPKVRPNCTQRQFLRRTGVVCQIAYFQIFQSE